AHSREERMSGNSRSGIVRCSSSRRKNCQVRSLSASTLSGFVCGVIARHASYPALDTAQPANSCRTLSNSKAERSRLRMNEKRETSPYDVIGILARLLSLSRHVVRSTRESIVSVPYNPKKSSMLAAANERHLRGHDGHELH